MNRSRVPTHSRAGKTADAAATRRVLRHLPLASAISAVLAGAPVAYAQKAESTGGLEEVVVTAQKKSENMQDVPVAITAFGTEKLEDLNIQNLDDYVKYLPSVNFSRGDGQGSNGQPGASHVYMRGIVSSPNENHSGSQPSVGMYLDEQPVTTIDGTVDVHVYDIARVEVLEGPQGTLYGASSEAGTIRIITNKPDPTKFAAGYDLTVSNTYHGGVNYGAEGFVNLPLSPIAAIRIVAWDNHAAGFISNVAGTNQAAGIVNGIRTFPTWCAANECTPYSQSSIGSGSISNAGYVQNDYNTADTQGARAAMKIDLGDNWTVTPTVMGQSATSDGFFGYDPAVGDLSLVHFGPENSQDSWVQGALTVEGKFSNFDLVYAGAYMKRNTHSIADYSDYSFFYDTLFGSGSYWRGNSSNPANPAGGNPIMPQELVYTHGYFEKFSHELRLTTPQEYPVKGTVGLFVERQLHDIYEQYIMPGYGFSDPFENNANGFAQYLSIPTLNNTVWLTDEQRVDRDQAAFAQVSWDITSQLQATVGMRHFKYDNSLQGFYGYSANYEAIYGGPGMSGIPNPNGGPNLGACVPGGPTTDASQPCSNLNKEVSDTGNVPRVNLTYKFTPDKMLYATYSKGFRPGGVNRNGDLPPYQADYLKNYEVGWKTQWLNHHLRWNGAVFLEKWDNFQFSFLGQYSLTIIENGGDAKIKGVESSLDWAVGGGLMLSLNGQMLDARTTTNYCGTLDANGNPITNCATPQAASGMNLPLSPKFKANAVARETFALANDWDANLQAAYVYQTQTAPDLRPATVAVVGMQPAYGLLDLNAGVQKDALHVDLFITNAADKRAELTRFVQSASALQPYIIPSQPRTIGIRFGQKF